MPSAGFELTIPVSERPQTYALDRAATGIGIIQIMVGQNQPENVECFNYLRSMIRNAARCTRKIKSRIAMAKAAFNKKKALFTSKSGLNLRKKLVTCYIWC
jgi:hypothetical protein